MNTASKFSPPEVARTATSSLFRPLDDVLKQGSSHAIHVEKGTNPVDVTPTDNNRLAKLDRFVGWHDKLDPQAAQLRSKVLAIMKEWEPRAAQDYHQGRFPVEVFRVLGEAGALGASLVGRDGAAPASKLATCAVMNALEYGDGGMRCAVTVHDSVIQAVSRFGSNRQKEMWLDRMVRGELVCSFALTEPNAGSDIRAISTTATRSGDSWLISGEKSWITNGPTADLILLWARTGERNDAIRGFLVERATAGLEIEQIDGAYSMRVAPVGRLHLDKVRVPANAMLPHAWGLTDINACLDYNRLTVLFGVSGAARRCLDIALEYVTQRQQFGVSLASKQLVQTALADMTERVAMAEMACLHLAERWQHGALPRFDVSLTKRANCASSLEVARLARSLLGANGCDLGHHVMRHMLNLEASYSYGGTNEIHGLVVGKELTNENAF